MEKKQTIGIDVSSQKLNLHFLEEKFDFEIPNAEKSIHQFIKKQKLDPKNCIIGAESTSRYHLICQEFFVNSGFEFRLLNPILTNSKITLSIRKKKTDRNDAKFIAQLIDQGEGRIMDKSQLDTTKKTLLRTRTGIVNQRSGIKIMLQELKRVKRNSKIEQAILALETLISRMDECVKTVENQALHKFEKTKEEKLIQTLPGFAERLSAIVATEAGDFSRFPTATQFKAYVGIDPKVIQSGGSLKTGRITKRGNVHLRTAFYLAAQVARCHDPQLKAFYQKKKSEGKPTRVAIIAVARKLCERVFAIVKKGTPYEIRESQSQLALA